MMNKPFSQACENNKKSILNILSKVFSNNKNVLEIGSGTGQHAVFFGQNLPHLTWQTSDLAINHQGINLWLDETICTNIQRPIVVDLNEVWPLFNQNQHQNKNKNKNKKGNNQSQNSSSNNLPIDGLYTANTLHIISWALVVKFFEGIAKNLTSEANVCIYGPFNYQGTFTSESNANFDLWLKDRDINSGIRDIEAILLLATKAGLKLIDDHAMPANNRLLIFSKK